MILMYVVYLQSEYAYVAYDGLSVHMINHKFHIHMRYLESEYAYAFFHMHAVYLDSESTYAA